MILREVRFRYWCTVCGHGAPGWYLTVAENEPWQAMHEGTNYHRGKVALDVFHRLTQAY